MSIFTTGKKFAPGARIKKSLQERAFVGNGIPQKQEERMTSFSGHHGAEAVPRADPPP
jgi:hypothetical protein